MNEICTYQAKDIHTYVQLKSHCQEECGMIKNMPSNLTKL